MDLERTLGSPEGVIGPIVIDVRLMWGSGTGTYIRHLVPLVLKAFPRLKFHLLGRSEEMERWEPFRGDQVTRVGLTSRLFSLGEQWEVVSKIPTGTALFWSPHYNFPLLWRGKLMLTVHDTLHLTMGWQIPGIHRRLYAKGIYRYLARRADAILTVSEFTRQELVARTGVLPEKVTVTHNGVDPSWFGVKRGGSPHPRKYLLYVGIVKPHKNLGGLLRAFEILKDKIDHDLVWVGKKDGFLVEDKQVLEAVQKLGPRVHVMGHVEEEKLRRYYANADLLIFPSFHEGFGLPPLEAMACGVPVAVSRVAAMPEVCGQAAQYFDPSDPDDMARKILEVLQDPSRRAELIRLGLEQAKKYTWEACAQGSCRVIESLLIATHPS